MKHSILSRFALFNVAALAIVICVSTLVSNWYISNDIAEEYFAAASVAA